MNIESYHQQQQRFPPHNADQLHPSQIGQLNENDPRLNHNPASNQQYAGDNVTNGNISPGNPVGNPNINDLSRFVGKMSIQGQQHNRPQVAPNMNDRNPQPDMFNPMVPQHKVMQPNSFGAYPGNTDMLRNPSAVNAMNSGPQLIPANNGLPSAPPVSPNNYFPQSVAPSMPPPVHSQFSHMNNNGVLPPSQTPYMPQPSQKPLYPPSFPPPPHARNPDNSVNDNAFPQPMMQAQYPNLNQMHQQPIQQQYQRKLDPDQMPNPIQVMKEDQELRSNEPFITNQPGLMPPLVTTNFIVEDEGNANPRFIRSTLYNVPCSVDMMKQTDLPFSLVITPLATLPREEQPPPVVNTGEFGPVRCVRCKGYMNPYMKFIDGGRRFVCNLCSAVTEVPQEYFQHLDHTGNRVDRYERPELIFGAYEFTVTKEYCKDNEVPNVPVFIFLIDVSYNNIKSGMVSLLCQQLTDIVQNYLPTDEQSSRNNDGPRMRVGFITYDTTIHFYNIKSCLGQPQMMIVGDMEDMFVPLVDGFLCDPVESLTVINSLMQQIPNTFANTRETDTLLLPAIQAGLAALKAAKCAGKLIVFHSSLPTGNVPGKLISREDRKLLATDKEKTILMPQNAVYTNLAQECVTNGCSVDLFLFNNAFVDLATIGQLSKLTGGEVFKYTYFQADVDGERLLEDVKRNLSRQIAFDAVMRVRTSTGVRPQSFYGHLHMTTTTDLELASINADKSVAVEIKHDDKLNEEDGVFIQVALLYTSCSGERRVRIFNLALKCCIQMVDLFRNCDLDTIVNYWSKSAVTKLLEGTPKQVKEGLVNKCVHILACYRKLCANPSSPGQLILPECMKLLPLYTNCLLKSDAISGGSDMTVDDRVYMMQAVSIMDIPSSVNYFYPRLIPLVNINYHSNDVPDPIRCSGLKISNSEAYILENGIYMFLWLGSMLPNEWIQNIFGVADLSSVNTNIFRLPVFDNIYSRKINSIVNQIQAERRRTMKLTVLCENDKMEIVFRRFLVEDATGNALAGDNLSSSSYVDFLCQMHREIRNILS